ncbi:MAG: hypothetical protein QXI36_02040, partial [Candidatus Bathyarchaeia archaeon]
MGTFLVRLFSPYTLKTFSVRVDAATAEMAKDKVLYQTIKLPDGTVKRVPKVLRDPDGYEFEAEEHYVISVTPISAIPMPPFELMPEEDVKKAEWLKPAIVTEPLAKGSTPVGSPRLETEIPNAVTTVLFSQEVKSKCIRFKEPYTLKERHYSSGEVECYLTWSQARQLCETKFKVLKSPPLMPLIDPKGKALREGEEVTYSDPEDLEWAKLETARGNLQQITTPIAEWLYPEYIGKVKYHI